MLKLNKNKFLLLFLLIFVSSNFCDFNWWEKTGVGFFVAVTAVAAEEIWTGGKFLGKHPKTTDDVTTKQKSLAGCLGVASAGAVLFLLRHLGCLGRKLSV